MKRLRRIAELTSWQIFLRASLICGLLGVVLFSLSVHKIDPLPVSNHELSFDAAKAHSYMTQLAKGFPNRSTWSDNRRRAALWLKQEFRSMGYTPQSMHFSEVIAGKQYTDLENIWVERRGTKHPDEIIIATGHYDITDTTVEGAMDDASGVGVTMELARLFSTEHPDRTILFLLTDSEEFGSFWGARAFTQNFDRIKQVVSVASFDFLAPEKQTKILTICDGLKQGYTPLWLRELALDSLRSLGQVQVLDFTNIVEHVERAMQIPPADHGPFLAAGVPAFNWVGQTDNFAYEMAHYHHTPHDVAEAMRPESFDSMGKGAERLIRSVDELNRIPEDFRNSSYWKITRNLYLDGWVVTLLHILAFIPFLAYSVSKFGRTLKQRSPDKVWKVIQNEGKNFAILLGSLLLGYAVMLVLPALRVITQYEAFPATQKSVILSTPNFVAMFLVIGSVLGVYWIFKNTFADAEDSLDSSEIRHAVHAILIATTVFLAFLKNSYLACLLLLPPAYFWTALRARKRSHDRWLNMLLLMGGSITFVTTAIVLTTVFYVGAVYWWLFLSAAYGLISAYTVVLFFMALTIMIRLFRSFVM